MPLIPSDYKPPFIFRNGHFSTIYAGVFRKINGVIQNRERLELPDGDFMDLDWSESKVPTHKVCILLHGLEGSAQRHYITGSAKSLNLNGYDVCAVNFRGCSGVPNRLYKSYHSGASEDLHQVVAHILQHKKYEQLYLKGFSLGGNVILKYLGEQSVLSSKIVGAVTVSVPCSLESACAKLLASNNALYSKRFKKTLLEKLYAKQAQFPDKLSVEQIKSIATLKDFDDVYTGPAHGFKDAVTYYTKCSSKQFLAGIKVPTLLINAKNDTFLGPECYPYEEAVANDFLNLEVPDFGGHVGFWGKENISYTEERCIQFFKNL
ncbi:YheT family hydrolase [Flavobacterium sp. ASW18X]|uniref:YheT family hydrolase n=1 Tax=Flavobacterium sp. ASW18X TaxID=2572595 RepID=UPI0010AE4B2F|nr:alpha/beta fold hydrolase [Flavobacterium sp. ASW18X]TKD65305.1 alpha/beta fold hydrolase [Flavobacterium sp. ASW18X]